MEISDEEKLTGRQKVCMIILRLPLRHDPWLYPWGDLNESIADGRVDVYPYWQCAWFCGLMMRQHGSPWASSLV